MTNERDVRSAIKRLEALGPRVWLRPGDHVVVSRSDGLYDHHGIVVPRNHTSGWQPDTFLPRLTGAKPELQSLWVLHFVKGSGDSGHLRRTPLIDFLGSSPRILVAFHPDTGHLPPEEVVHRAVAFEGRGDYSLVAGNCEHFSTWCATGHWSSTQVRSAGTGAAVLLGLVNPLVGLVAGLVADGMSQHDAHGCDQCMNRHCRRSPHPWGEATRGREEDYSNLIARVNAAERDAKGLVLLADGSALDFSQLGPRIRFPAPNSGPPGRRPGR